MPNPRRARRRCHVHGTDEVRGVDRPGGTGPQMDPCRVAAVGGVGVHHDRRGRRDERGQSLSAMVLVVMTSLFLLAGLVIDGGQQVVATRRAESVAAATARVGADAGAAALVGSADPVTSAADARRAASTYLTQSPDVTGSVSVQAGVVQVRTSSTEPTVFLSLIGVGTVTGTGSAQAELFSVGG